MAEKKYTKGELTVLWQPDKCIHSEICFHGLPGVFDPDRRPWIDLDQAGEAAIKDQVNKCPSGALSLVASEKTGAGSPAVSVQLIPGGPVIIKGSCEIKDEQGELQAKDNVAFCRCSRSAKFPYCDGSHKR